MIAHTMAYNDRHHVVARASINHPHADEVSIAMGDGTASNFPHSVELTFFKNGKWVGYEMDELAKYCDGDLDHPVYNGVPLLDFAKFLDYWTEEN